MALASHEDGAVDAHTNEAPAKPLYTTRIIVSTNESTAHIFAVDRSEEEAVERKIY